MNTTNWQTKVLTLFIAAVALWLTTACGNADPTYYPINYPLDGIRVISSEPCEIDVPLVPSPEYIELEEKLNELGDELDYMETLDIREGAGESRYARLEPEYKRILEVLRTYEDLFIKYPYFVLASIESMRTWDGQLTDKLVVEVHIDHLVDLRTVPPEDRIPGCIAGVPVHFLVLPVGTPG